MQNAIFLHDTYFEYPLLAKAKSYLPKRGAYIDIGANIGNHTVFFFKECGLEKAYCYEPIADTFTLLKRNVVSNDP